MNKPIKPAATVVVLRRGSQDLEVLLLRRNPELVFAPDCWVFPGGKVEQSELDDAQGKLETANRSAAVRECFEETGIALDINDLLPISHWTTPKIRVKRFATQFYLCQLKSDARVTIDDSEIVEYRWQSANDALESHRSKQLNIMPPTYVTLHEIARYAEYSDLCKYYESRPPRFYNPKPTMFSKTLGSFLYEGDSGYETDQPELKDKLNRCEYDDGIIEHFCTID